MKASKLIELLQEIVKEQGDVEVRVSVSDSFSVHGDAARLRDYVLNVDTKIMHLKASLEKYIEFDGTEKRPHIVFRK